MKNKKFTIFLLGLVVIVIWGLILYRIFNAVNDNGDDIPIVSKTIVREPFDDYTVPKDTTHLLSNYRDPFGITSQKDTVKAVRALARNMVNTPLKPATDWSFIKYSGYVRNPNSKKLIAIMTINGQSEMMAEGETIDKVKLIKNMRDAIKVDFNGEIRSINMNH